MLDLKKKPYELTNNQIEFIHHQVDNMSTDEKIGQIFVVIGQDEDTIDISEFIEKYQPGGMMYRPDRADKIERELATAQKASKIPLFMAANLESGGNGIITEGTWFGMPLQVAASNDIRNAYQLGNVSGSEAHQVGVNMAFAPIIDISYNFRNPIVNTRTFGNSENRIQQMAQEQIKGLEDNDVIPVIKHFPGDGVDERDQHLLSSVNSLDADEWMASYGQLYRHFIQNGISSIMIGHILQPAWEKRLCPGIKDSELMPASASKLLINGLLRDKLGFNGLTITDATPMLGYNTAMSRSQLLVTSINAGVDMLLFNKNIDEDFDSVKNAIKDGTLSSQRLDEAVTRILATKIAQHIMNESGGLVPSSEDRCTVDLLDDQKKSAQLAQQSVTLVKDRDRILPITLKKYPKIRLIVLGDSDDGGFKEGGKVGPIFKKKLENVGFKVQLFDNKNLDFHEIFEEGIADLKEKFDLAIYVANIESASNQTTTRLNWIHLMAANAPWFEKDIPTVFISTANPYHLFDIPYISTYINAYTGNRVTVSAIIRKILGREEFFGISPVDPFCGDPLTRY
ncbi:glycoside hydrolase family 3 protein [Lactiplantibacillus plantarum]|uniref:glycoside hydrolase family 3 protein n=1 Tax=Lactiplantibacillus plantarum TaxID=1590 RepID=UPI001362F49C|nr:glycoside hydrolase family 3 N-terminal domain-containing protein [Lactiplantibacillus plantarum]MCB7177507.1 glycoside hydrolase family 3 protein [Lactiplantibacillus plantarum]QHM32635.1 Beta-N-acetylglucosaminidase/beta-glucosidase [Lactiplantibacillus plantarum]